MDKFKKVASYVFTNRRLIGIISGSLLALFGYPDEGAFIQGLGEH